MLGQTASPERLKQLLDVVPEEATGRRIANLDEATFRGLYLGNAAQRRVSGSASIAQESAYLRSHVQAATDRRRARQVMLDAEKRWGGTSCGGQSETAGRRPIASRSTANVFVWLRRGLTGGGSFTAR
jgi:hypothetical protein